MKLTNQTSKLVPLGFIYALVNPKTKEIFYIGATESSPKDRLQGHYSQFKEYLSGKRGKTKKFEYFESLYPDLAEVKLLKIVQNEYLYKIEQEYIKEYSKKYNLVNQTIGGEGGDTFTLQEHVDKLKISELIGSSQRGKVKSDEFKENLSKQRIGSSNPMAGTDKMGPVVVFKNNVPIKVCNAPFEITMFFDEVFGIENHKKHSGKAGNISKKMRTSESKTYNSSGYVFKSLSVCDDKEIQDIVQN